MAELLMLFGAIKRQAAITTNGSCGVHVHVSPRENHPWQLDEVKCLALAIIYWEAAIWKCLPSDRRENIFAKANWKQN
jgi:hypothetical protein